MRQGALLAVWSQSQTYWLLFENNTTKSMMQVYALITDSDDEALPPDPVIQQLRTTEPIQVPEGRYRFNLQI